MRAILLPLILVVGCSSYGLVKPDPPPIDAHASPPPGMAQVCVLRPHWLASAVTYVVHDNGVLVGATRGPTYFCWLAAAGPHVITSECDDILRDPIELRALLAPDVRYYIHESPNPLGHSFEWVPPEKGAEMVARCGYRRVVSAPSSEHVPPPTPIVNALAPTSP